MQKFAPISTLFLCLLSLSCAQADFKRAVHKDETSRDTKTVDAPGASSEAVSPVEGEGSANENAALRDGSETFTVELTKNQVDIVWVIDNSSSMGEEVAQVRKNFEDFITNTSSFAEVKIALISSAVPPPGPQILVNGVPTSTTNVALPATAAAKGHVQINQFVSSTNLLAMAAAASCPAASSKANVVATTTSEEHRICDQSLKANLSDATQISGRVESPLIIDQVKGSLSSFFRAKAKRAYIFVTDDDSSGLRSDKFFTSVQVGTPNIKPYVFAFRGVANQGACRITRAGADYDMLAKNSGGDVFDICAADWKPYFNKLTASLNDIARTEFALEKAKIQKIVSISIDEKPLDPQLYTFIDGKVKIDPSALQAGQKITINYAYAEEP